ncbi:MAG TPA: hypothetical protein PKD85_19825, partial [Saprospiraceae bacterium]|nr:hypothetical protein [Saprospiraceae bacterium]
MRYIVAIVFFVLSQTNYGQNPAAYRTFEAAKSALPLCDLTLLNDKNYINDPFDPNKGTRDLPCGRGGKLENFLIFPFIANATSLEILISNQLCSRPVNGLLGLQ